MNSLNSQVRNFLEVVLKILPYQMKLDFFKNLIQAMCIEKQRAANGTAVIYKQ